MLMHDQRRIFSSYCSPILRLSLNHAVTPCIYKILQVSHLNRDGRFSFKSQHQSAFRGDRQSKELVSILSYQGSAVARLVSDCHVPIQDESSEDFFAGHIFRFFCHFGEAAFLWLRLSRIFPLTAVNRRKCLCCENLMRALS